MNIIKAIEKRRSIRKFSKKTVSEKKIEKIIWAGTLAPSAKNRQPWKFIVCTQNARENLLKAMETGINRETSGNMRIPEFDFGLADAKNTLRVMKEAPVLIVILNTNGKSPFLPVNDAARIVEICDSLSIGAAIENINLTAISYGLGALWIANTCFAYEELEKEIGTDCQIIGILALGYMNESPSPRPRKPFEDVIEFRR